MKRTLWDAVVIGGGPAGLAAGMHLARAGYRALLVEKGTLGGQARRLERVENYPGFPEGVSGRALMALWIRQARRWGLSMLSGEARSVASGPEGFRVKLARGRALAARSILRCTGAPFKKLGVPGERRLFGRGVWHTAFEEAARLRGRNVAVAGSGEAAAHQAVHLARGADKVYLLTRGERIKAHPLLRRRLAACGNVLHFAGARVTAAEGARTLRRVWIRPTQGGARRALEVSGLFVLIGRKRRPLNPPPGLFVAGDARGERFRQVAVAGGDGARAAMECMDYLEHADHR